jgi:secondary thiamine-phosphate synthase enzyme
MERINIKTTKEKEIVDITEEVEKQVEWQGINEGICCLFLTHTTAALTTADLDPGTDLDMLDVFEKIVPKLQFRHPHNPEHAPSHILSSLIGTSLVVPIENSELILGKWQRIVLVELDGPRDREIILNFIKP